MNIEFSYKGPGTLGSNTAFSSQGVRIILSPEDMKLPESMPLDEKAARMAYEVRRQVARQLIMDHAISPEMAKASLEPFKLNVQKYDVLAPARILATGMEVKQ